MELRLQILLPVSLYIRNPESTELGKKIMKQSVKLIHAEGFDAFTFKKLATKIGTTEAGVYRYFENKQQLLSYLTAWYWSWLEYQLQFYTNNILSPVEKLQRIVSLLSNGIEDDLTTSYINEAMMHHIISRERIRISGHEENKHQATNSYIDLCKRIAAIIHECKTAYPYPLALATTIIEMSHYHHYIKNHVDMLNDQSNETNNYLHEIVFASLGLEV